MRNCAKLYDNYAAALNSQSSINGIAGPSGGKRKPGATLVIPTDESTTPVNGKRKRETKVKDPNAPKRPPSAYLLFQNEVRKSLKEQYPSWSQKELLEKISQLWQEMADADKQVRSSIYYLP